MNTGIPERLSLHQICTLVSILLQAIYLSKAKYNLKPATVPLFDKKELNSSSRRAEILQELEESKAETLILLGDHPIYWFLRFFDKRDSRLSQFGETPETYGKSHPIKINDRTYNVIPLCHPRQADRFGASSTKWGKLHDF